MWGSSAGGHLAGYLAAIHDHGTPASAGPIDRVSNRTDFAILSYARLTMNPDVPRKGSMEALIGENTRRVGVPAEMHVFERGPHGTGMAQTLAPEMHELTIWPTLLAAWMTQNHLDARAVTYAPHFAS